MAQPKDPGAIIAQLKLQPHPEGGFYREIYRDEPASGGRGHMTSIYYLLAAGDRSHWHRVDAVEIWHWYAGDALTLSLSEDAKVTEESILGNDLTAGQSPQIIIPAGVWQSAWSLGDWTLVGCTVAPAFEFAGFELAPPDWQPG